MGEVVGVALSAWTCARSQALRRRRWDFLKNFHLGGLWLNLARHLVLTGGKLLDGCSHVGKMPLDGLSHRGNIRLYLLYCRELREGAAGAFGATVSGAACATGTALFSTTGAFVQPSCWTQLVIICFESR
jgi:hypothetical protein